MPPPLEFEVRRRAPVGMRGTISGVAFMVSEKWEGRGMCLRERVLDIIRGTSPGHLNPFGRDLRLLSNNTQSFCGTPLGYRFIKIDKAFDMISGRV